MPCRKMSRPVLLAASVAAGAAAIANAQQKTEPLTMGPQRERGASVTPAFEGWFENPDGTYSLLVGYYNRNSKEALDIPIGPNNRIEPGPPDQGQPTHFEPGRRWGVFVLRVPKDFGKQTISWTLVANGEVQSIPFTLNPGYPITPYHELGMGNKPPALSFSQGGPKVTGPPTAVATTLAGTAGQPTPIEIWVEDPKPEYTSESGRGRGGSSVAMVSLHKHRGPGTVTFDRARYSVARQGDVVSATATFSAPGEYVLRVQANDESGEGGGGFQCCWTNTYVKVAVQ
jgi:hypothetical protein